MKRYLPTHQSLPSHQLEDNAGFSNFKDAHRRQKLRTDFLTFGLTILVVIISISRKKYSYHVFRGSYFKGLDHKIIGFVSDDRYFLQFEIHKGLDTSFKFTK